jgi:CheY-like chemotaxis protein
VRETLEEMLTGEGHRVTVASSGEARLDIVARDGLRLDLLISDYNLRGQLDGVQAAAAVRSALGWEVPAIILSGDVRAEKQRILRRAAASALSSRPRRVNFLNASARPFLEYSSRLFTAVLGSHCQSGCGQR